MAFQYNAFSQKISTDPEAAHARLVVLFKRHGLSTTDVAKDIGVNVTTLRRWVKRLADQGFPDPGYGTRAARGVGKPKP